VRIRGVPYGAMLLLAVAGCAGQSPAAPAAPPAWSEPADYKFAFESTCGERALIGHFRADVVGGTVTETVGLDDAARRALMLRIADLVPTLGAMVDQAEEAKAAGGTMTITRDATDGHPTDIRIDPDPDGIDDESCYRITEYTIGGQPGPDASPSR
jgi:hypothetical protein